MRDLKCRGDVPWRDEVILLDAVNLGCGFVALAISVIIGVVWIRQREKLRLLIVAIASIGAAYAAIHLLIAIVTLLAIDLDMSVDSPLGGGDGPCPSSA
ncbi:hypothetical protein ACFWUP_17855 [Nocardia sp. NPDC058658]|uniref:hypothetical protein n=1 Tax=Nocardia sp. NPDC058658 TaxID=3346580 RepID=UPI003649240E